MTKPRRTTIFLAAEDYHQLARLQERYGLSTLSAALRFAIRHVVTFQEDRAFLHEHLRSTKRTLESEREKLFTTQQELETTLQIIESLNQEIQALSTVYAEQENERVIQPEAQPLTAE